MIPRIVQGYYLATPLFWFIDEVFNFSVRASALDGHALWKTLYYLFCLGCAYVVFKYPNMGFISLVESVINLILLFVGFLAPYFMLVGSYEAASPFINPFTPAHILNFVLAGTMAIVSLNYGFFQRSVEITP